MVSNLFHAKQICNSRKGTLNLPFVQ
jgi:hypothetical protein